MGNAMGVNTWAAFIGSDEKALVDGDFAMYESEVTGVLKALRHAGHQHRRDSQSHDNGKSPRHLPSFLGGRPHYGLS